MLHNIPNIQASWLTVGKATAQAALHSGANDMGSIMIEENVVSSAGAHNSFDAEGIQSAIREAGFIAPAGPALPDAGICAANRGTCDIASRRLTAHHAAMPKCTPAKRVSQTHTLQRKRRCRKASPFS